MKKQSIFSGEMRWSATGVGFKPAHFREIVEARPDLDFFEVHAENYMGDGGRPHRDLARIREDYELSIHGVGLSIGGEQPLDEGHLLRLKKLTDRYVPVFVSEHLAWSRHGHVFLNDLLPIPYTAQRRDAVIHHIDQVQDHLGRQILLENPSTYVAYAKNDYDETGFIAEVVARTGCGLLLDVNNVVVASVNQRWDPFRYVDALPLKQVQQIHLAGYRRDADEKGDLLLIDAHDRAVDADVWRLFDYVISRAGSIPTLIEWDTNLPDWSTLYDEAKLAGKVMNRAAARRAAGAA